MKVKNIVMFVLVVGFLTFCWYAGNRSPLAEAQKENENLKTELATLKASTQPAATQPVK